MGALKHFSGLIHNLQLYLGKEWRRDTEKTMILGL